MKAIESIALLLLGMGSGYAFCRLLEDRWRRRR